MRLDVPSGANLILNNLNRAGYDAYVVGGCVRDTILGIAPNDWDICTSATPEESIKALEGMHIVKTGIKHGTVTAIYENASYEVTTFRVDGKYSDNRHPEKVKFVTDIKEDLARRDFTVNAMAYNDKKGLIDPFGGREDLANGIIRCVGEPCARFEEDGLRIMRALRFSSVYGFKIEENTAKAIHSHKDLLLNTAKERISAELLKMITGKGILSVMLEYSDVMQVIIPEFAPCIGFDQRTRWHIYDVYEHIARALAAYEGKDNVIALTLLLHDIGKPQCFTQGEDGAGHFRGHPEKGAILARDIIARLKFDSYTRKCVTELISLHDTPLYDDEKCVKKLLRQIGEEQFFRLIEIKRCDASAQADIDLKGQFERLEKAADTARRLLDSGACIGLKDLAINGADLIKEGIDEGAEIGNVLEKILDEITEGKLDNDRKMLLEYVKRIKKT